MGDIQVDTGYDMRGSRSERPLFSLSCFNKQHISLGDSRIRPVSGPSHVYIYELLFLPYPKIACMFFCSHEILKPAAHHVLCDAPLGFKDEGPKTSPEDQITQGPVRWFRGR